MLCSDKHQISVYASQSDQISVFVAYIIGICLAFCKMCGLKSDLKKKKKHTVFYQTRVTRVKIQYVWFHILKITVIVSTMILLYP